MYNSPQIPFLTWELPSVARLLVSGQFIHSFINQHQQQQQKQCLREETNNYAQRSVSKRVDEFALINN